MHPEAMAARLYYDSRFLDHNTGSHPERAGRLEPVIARLEGTGLAERCERSTWRPVADERLFAVHPRDHVERLGQLAAKGGGRVDPDTVVSPASVEVARLAAGAVCDAVAFALSETNRSALCLVRPPGHHALADRAMGFCLFNHVAIAARAALSRDVGRILIVDWDVHHGNGTQAIFYDEPRVGFFSVHRWPFYPGTGSVEETGTGDGLGTTRNLPLEFGTSRHAYRQQVLRELDDFATRIQPELVLVSAGFDSHRDDPIGSLGLEVEDFEWLTKAVVEVARTYAGGRLISTLEGGYNPPVLAECVAVHLQTLLDFS